MTDPETGPWRRWPSPGDAGWSAVGLAAARTYAETLQTAAVLVVAEGRIVAEWGDIARPYPAHSIRKSLLSALIGIHESAGRIDLAATLAELGIDDRQGLTAREKLATVLDLLTARSGVYHPSGFETPWMVAIKPPRGSAGPGMSWCYNNWDFNALGTIVQRLTGADLFVDFAQRIAGPCGMEDFRPSDHGRLVALEESDHPAYPFQMSARDLARFGLLYLRHGLVGDRTVVPAGWVARSLLPYSEAGVQGAYGFMWWVARSGILYENCIVPERTFAARGAHGHRLVVLPALDAVIVHRVDSGRAGRSVAGGAFGRLLQLILDAAPSSTPPQAKNTVAPGAR